MNLDFTDLKVLLIGDFMLDIYLLGDSSRMSPEFPVPVVIPKEEYSVPGGAANVAINLSAMGAKVFCMGYVGNDSSGVQLLKLLENENINCDQIETLNLKTTSKKRFIVNNKQIMRLDIEENIKDWAPKSYRKNDFNEYDYIIFSDYDKGVLNSKWFESISSKTIFVDPKKDDFRFYSNAHIITPNLNELQRATDIQLEGDDSIQKACKKILNETSLEYIVVKKGDKGITVVGRENFIHSIDALQVNQPDVTGAGDTVIAALSLAFIKNKNIIDSVKFANAAASISVSKTGTSYPSIKELKDLLSK